MPPSWRRARRARCAWPSWSSRWGAWQLRRQAQADALENLRKLAASLAEQRRLVETLQRQLQAAIAGRDRQAQVLAGRREEREAFQRQLAAAPEIEAAYRSWQSARGALEGWESLAAQYLQQQSRRAVPLMEIETERARLAQELQALLAQQQALAAAQAEIPALGGQQAQAQAAVDRTAGSPGAADRAGSRTAPDPAGPG